MKLETNSKTSPPASSVVNNYEGGRLPMEESKPSSNVVASRRTSFRPPSDHSTNPTSDLPLLIESYALFNRILSSSCSDSNFIAFRSLARLSQFPSSAGFICPGQIQVVHEEHAWLIIHVRLDLQTAQATEGSRKVDLFQLTILEIRTRW